MLRRTMVVDGEIIADGTSAIASKVLTIKSALALDGGDAVLHSSVGTIALLNGGSIGGVRVVERPSFTAQDGRAHWATGLPFRIVFEADYPYLTDGLVSYTESITKVGNGGSRRVVLELDNGAPVEQTVSSNTPIQVIQTGVAVGFLAYPTFNDPIFPGAIMAPEDLQTATELPRLARDTWVDWPIRWTYRMTLTNPTTVPYPLRK